MTPLEEERIRKWAHGIEREVTFYLVLKEDEPGRRMNGFCEYPYVLERVERGRAHR